MDREKAVRMWREACGKYAADANCPPTGMMLEQFARRVEAAAVAEERERLHGLLRKAVEVRDGPRWPLPGGDENMAMRKALWKSIETELQA